MILANHPQAGGSHLPDLTVITPVFYENIDKPVFFVANRGHHADIGQVSHQHELFKKWPLGGFAIKLVVLIVSYLQFPIFWFIFNCNF